MEQSGSKSERLAHIFEVMKNAPQPNSGQEAHRLLRETFNASEAFEIGKNRMCILPFDTWYRVKNYHMWYGQYKKHWVFITAAGDIQILQILPEDRVRVSPEDHPLFFYNYAKQEGKIVFSKTHPGDCWERSR